MKSANSLLLIAQGFISFFRNLFVPQRISRTLETFVKEESSCNYRPQWYIVEDNGDYEHHNKS